MSTTMRKHLETEADDGGLVHDFSARGAALAGAALFGLRADTLDLPDADLRDAALNEARLADCSFTRARIDGTAFDRAQMWQCNMRRCQGRRTRFQRARIEAGFFEEASLPGADFEEAVIEDVRFDGADLSWARFTGATLDRVRFTDAELTGADFRGARLARVDFSGARLAGALFDAGNDPRMNTEPVPSADPARARPPSDGKKMHASTGAAPTNLAEALTALVSNVLASEDRATLTSELTALLATTPASERAMLAFLLEGPSLYAEPWPAELQALVGEIRSLPGTRPEQLAHVVPALLRSLAAREAPADRLRTLLPTPTGRGPETDEVRARRLRDEAAEAIAVAIRSRGQDHD